MLMRELDYMGVKQNGDLGIECDVCGIEMFIERL